MDKSVLSYIIQFATILGSGIIALCVYIWRDNKKAVAKEDKTLFKLFEKYESKTDTNIKGLYKIANENTGNIKVLIEKIEHMREGCMRRHKE